MDIVDLFQQILSSHHLSQCAVCDILGFASANQMTRILKRQVSHKYLIKFGNLLLAHKQQLELTDGEVALPHIQKTVDPASGDAGIDGFLHFINQREHDSLLLRAQSRPALEQLSLRFGQRDGFFPFREQLGERDSESLANLLQGGNGRNHVLAIPRGDGGLRQAGAFRKLVFRPSPIFTIKSDGFKDILHCTPPLACISR